MEKVVKEMSGIISTGMATKRFVFYPNEPRHHFTSVTKAAAVEAWFVLQECEINTHSEKHKVTARNECLLTNSRHRADTENA